MIPGQQETTVPREVEPGLDASPRHGRGRIIQQPQLGGEQLALPPTELGEAGAGLIQPDDLLPGHPDLRSMALRGGWPSWEAARGKIIFIAMMSEAERACYHQHDPRGGGRPMFVFGPPDGAATAFVKVDDPILHQDSIVRLTQAGYIVRTRADADTWEARSGDDTRLQAAIRSGAQMISTDYYRADPRAGQKGWSHYRAVLPGGAVAVPSATRNNPKGP